jgi:hypothetical protein
MLPRIFIFVILFYSIANISIFYISSIPILYIPQYISNIIQNTESNKSKSLNQIKCLVGNALHSDIRQLKVPELRQQMPSHPVILTGIGRVRYFMIFDPIPFFYALFLVRLVRLYNISMTLININQIIK